ncbi:universal stress protein [Listeria grandensis]|uniref:Universal stress protein n=1 Tax=Listeria grandensis TaxID=1494963 RepID=A0A7X0Y2T7_9LIST|nr:universal stress protein [Listeria grandensis]MBC1474416.1 universal stress protein [Listeria grandensis]MBC1935961.1 universal stress protein [Listeria grandensis]
MNKQILVAIDGSEQSNDAFSEAIRFAKLEKASLIFLTVIGEVMPNNEELYLSLDVHPEIDDVYRVLAEKRLENMTAELGSEIAYKNETVHGDAKRSIVKYAKENNVDLIVIGATGRGTIERTLIGSTTAYVVNHAPCNVMVVK